MYGTSLNFTTTLLYYTITLPYTSLPFDTITQPNTAKQLITYADTIPNQT